MIVSESNAKLKHIRRLLTQSKYRQKHQQCVIENRQCIDEIQDTHPEWISFILIRDPGFERENGISTFTVAAPIFDTIATIKGAQTLAVIHIPYVDPPSQLTTILYVDGIQIPSNLGAIIRSAVAFNVDIIAQSPETCDPYHPESIRASAGTVLQIPLRILSLTELQAQYSNFVCYALDANGGHTINTVPLSQQRIIIIGAEKGISTETLSSIPETHRIVIPINNAVDSLNVAVSVGILLYQSNL
jgi:TrmH family RNA methyltransferase